MRSPADDDAVVLLARCASPAESEILCAYLAAHGVAVGTRGDSRGAGPSAIEVMVPGRQLGEARALVTAFHQAAPLGDDDWDGAPADLAPLPRAVVRKR